MTKRIYDENSMQTEMSIEFGHKIQEAVRPIIEEYLAAGFCIRDLSHESFGAIRDIELCHIMNTQVEKAQKK